MSDQKIELEIVLDDGSIKKTFGTIKKEAESVSKESSGMFNGFSGLGGSLIVFNQGLELAGKFARAVKSVGEEMINISLEAEKIRVIQAQFNQLTEQSGIATQEFSDKITQSIAGLMDDDDALSAANNAMIRLGLSAQRLPEIFELSRKAAASGFGSMAENADALTTAIQTGQTKQLKSLGVIVDLSKAQADFAASIGLASNQLTEQQKIFVNSNAILDKFNKKFGESDGNIKAFSDSWTRLKVNVDEAIEQIRVKLDGVFGKTLKNAIDGFNLGISNILGNTTADQKIDSLRRKMEQLSQSYEDVARKNSVAATVIGMIAQSLNDDALKNLNEQIKITREEIRKLESEKPQKDLLRERILQYQEYTNAIKLNAEQQKKLDEEKQARDAQVAQAALSYNQQELASRQQRLQYIQDDDARALEAALIFEEQLKQIKEKGELDRKNIAIQYSDEKKFSEEQRMELEAEQLEAENQAIAAIQDRYNEETKSKQQKFLDEAKAAWQNTYSVIANTVSSGLGNAFLNMGKAMKAGKNAFDAFADGMIQVAADVASIFGDMLIKMGVGYLFFNPVAGVGMILAGGILKAFAGLIAPSGGAASAPSLGASSGGGIASENIDSGFNAASPTNAERIQPNTVVNFTVQGDIMDSDGTQNRIVQLLNDAIDTKGAVVRGMT